MPKVSTKYKYWDANRNKWIKILTSLQIEKGIANFSGNNLETQISHGLGQEPRLVNVYPVNNPEGYLGEVWIRKDNQFIWVGNTGDYNGQFKWVVIV